MRAVLTYYCRSVLAAPSFTVWQRALRSLMASLFKQSNMLPELIAMCSSPKAQPTNDLLDRIRVAVETAKSIQVRVPHLVCV